MANLTLLLILLCFCLDGSFSMTEREAPQKRKEKFWSKGWDEEVGLELKFSSLAGQGESHHHYEMHFVHI